MLDYLMVGFVVGVLFVPVQGQEALDRLAWWTLLWPLLLPLTCGWWAVKRLRG